MLARARGRSTARGIGGMAAEAGVSDIQEKIDFESRMREGTCKLLAVSTQRDQVLHAAKNLLTCSARIIRYRAELQKHSEGQILAKVSGRSSDTETKERVPCSGKVAISGIRIPLMWKDSDHFNYRGRSQRFAVFCLLKIEAQIFDTEMVIVDKALTDICFEDLMIL
ncbi:rhotekin-2-like isoform X3 [Mobula hypostoma]|uniref:rhotekin-2-like isoform X3 n=1 Tax=Mobula hypostoma TaxID=723540 RepID=UPI002FC311DF